MSDANKRVTVTLGVRGDSADFAKLKSQFSEFGTWLKASVGLNIGTDLYNSFKRMVTLGVEFNATLETAQLGIAAVLRTFQPGQFTTFDNAMAASAKQIDELSTAALSTVASFEELLEAYQSIAGAAFAAGIPMEKQVGLAVLISQAVAGIGMPTNQVAQEARALLTGKITADARLARTLGISTEDVNKAKQQGRLLEFLTSKMVGFSEAGARASQTFSGMLSNLKDLFTQIAGRGAESSFQSLKATFDTMLSNLSKPQFQDGILKLGDLIGSIVAAGASGVSRAAQNSPADLFGGGVLAGGAGALALKYGAGWYARAMTMGIIPGLGLMGLAGIGGYGAGKMIYGANSNALEDVFLKWFYGTDNATIALDSARLARRPTSPTAPRASARQSNGVSGVVQQLLEGIRTKVFDDMGPILAATANARAPEGLAKSGLYTSFGAAIMAKQGLSLQREMTRNTARTVDELIRLRSSFAGLI